MPSYYINKTTWCGDLLHNTPKIQLLFQWEEPGQRPHQQGHPCGEEREEGPAHPHPSKGGSIMYIIA